ncbi:MAG: hypothetical protein JWM95_1519, partial [Gemmatimonadetes bacterium]|nr:hypothetical protein [Gemmatimonadota bacterium]
MPLTIGAPAYVRGLVTTRAGALM